MPHTKQQPEQAGKRPTSRLVSIGQIAGALSALIGLGVVIATHLPSGGSPPAVSRAEVHVLLHAPRTEHNYLAGVGKLEREENILRGKGIPQGEIRHSFQSPGVTVEYTTEIEATPGSEYHVSVKMFRAASEEPITPESEFVPDEPLVTSAGKFQQTFAAWMQYPPAPGTYFIEVGLLPRKGGGDVGKPRRSADFRVPG